MLDLLKIKNKKFVKNEAKANIRRELEDLVKIFDIAAQHKGIYLQFDCHENIPEEVVIDA